MYIAKIKIDRRGRIQLPQSFLKANEIKSGDYAIAEVVYNRHDAVRIIFVNNNKGVKDEDK